MAYPRTTRIPTPLYAAAGAGDFAYEQLRKLPAAVTDLLAADLRDKAAATTSQLRERAAATLRSANSTASSLRGPGGELDVDRLRSAALRNAAMVLIGAHAAQERAVAAYGALVARGERVVGTGVVQAADTVNADMETTAFPTERAEAPTGAATNRAESATSSAGDSATALASETGSASETSSADETPAAGAAAPGTSNRAGRPTRTPRPSKPAAKSTGPARGERATGRE